MASHCQGDSIRATQASKQTGRYRVVSVRDLREMRIRRFHPVVISSAGQPVAKPLIVLEAARAGHARTLGMETGPQKGSGISVFHGGKLKRIRRGADSEAIRCAGGP